MNKRLVNSWNALRDNVCPFIHPPHPGRGKNALFGFALGFLFGVFGVGLALRSMREALICLIFALPIAIGLEVVTFPLADLIVPLFCGFWVVAIIDRDNRAISDAKRTAPESDPQAHSAPEAPLEAGPITGQSSKLTLPGIETGLRSEGHRSQA